MACFLVPTGEAIVATIVKKKTSCDVPSGTHISMKTKLSWLTTMLWGGALLLALEHVWHGEVVLYPPFLTAMSSAQATAEMLQEMASVGVGMAVFVTAVWGLMCVVAEQLPQLREIRNKA